MDFSMDVTMDFRIPRTMLALVGLFIALVNNDFPHNSNTTVATPPTGMKSSAATQRGYKVIASPTVETRQSQAQAWRQGYRKPKGGDHAIASPRSAEPLRWFSGV